MEVKSKAIGQKLPEHAHLIVVSRTLISGRCSDDVVNIGVGPGRSAREHLGMEIVCSGDQSVDGLVQSAESMSALHADVASDAGVVEGNRLNGGDLEGVERSRGEG